MIGHYSHLVKVICIGGRVRLNSLFVKRKPLRGLADHPKNRLTSSSKLIAVSLLGHEKGFHLWQNNMLHFIVSYLYGNILVVILT